MKAIITILAAAAVFSLSGCANIGSSMSGSTYSSNQMQSGAEGVPGRIVQYREVNHDTSEDGPGKTIATLGGAVIGGLLGNKVGDGNGQKLATAAGAIAGAYGGAAINKATSVTKAWEYGVEMPDGKVRFFPQDKDSWDLKVGQEVWVISNGPGRGSRVIQRGPVPGEKFTSAKK